MRCQLHSISAYHAGLIRSVPECTPVVTVERMIKKVSIAAGILRNLNDHRGMGAQYCPDYVERRETDDAGWYSELNWAGLTDEEQRLLRKEFVLPNEGVIAIPGADSRKHREKWNADCKYDEVCRKGLLCSIRPP